MITTLRKCAQMMPPRLRRRWLALVPVAGLTTLAEIGAAAAVFVLLLALSSPEQAFAIPWVSQVLSWLPAQDRQMRTLQLLGLLAAYYVVKSLLLLAAQYLRLRVAHDSSAYLSSEMYRRYLSAPYPFHFRRNSAELIRNCTSSVSDVLGGVVSASVGLLTEVLTSLGLMAVLVATSPGLSMAAGLGLIGMMLLVLHATRGAAARLGGDSHALAADMLKGLQQSLGSIKEVKVLGRERYFYDDFVRIQQRLLMVGYLGITLGAVPSLLLQTVLVLGALALVAVLTVVGDPGVATLPVAGVFGYSAMRILPMANSFLATVNGIRASRPAVDTLYDDFVALGNDADAAERPDDADLAFTRSIALEAVSYRYPGADVFAVRDVSLLIRRGESIGIVGPTGAGKSTLVDLILGLLPPTAGRITVDGADLNLARRRWKRRVGYVPQAVFLIDDTLRRNVALGMADREIDDARIRRVLEMAQLNAMIDQLPGGIETRVGERGIRLSGGERQRVAIARALYHDPDLLVFDEATSSLDMATEADVTAAIESLHGLKTMIVIAHRLSTVRRCDRLVWLRGAGVAGVGSFDELRRGSDGFRELAAMAEL